MEKIKSLQAFLSAGDGIQQMMEVTGEEGVTTADYVTYQKALFLDMVFLQQDAFDEVDASTPLQRQHETLTRIHRLVNREYDFPDKAAARSFSSASPACSRT